MSMTNNDTPRSRKIGQIIITVTLWLATVLLGLLAVIELVRGVDAQILVYIFNRMQRDEMGIRTADSLSAVANLATILCTGLVWIGFVIGFGMTYHFKRVGKRSSYRVFAWTIGVEVVLILIGFLLETTFV